MLGQSIPISHDRDRAIELGDEIEQLRTTLETVLEDNAILVDERDRLRLRIGELGQELRITHAVMSRPLPSNHDRDVDEARQSQTEEELRVAFEELQVLTEELEVANTSLHQTNHELDARVEQRTRQLRDINAALQSTEAALRTVADLVPELLWRADRAGQADWFNQRWYAVTGQEPEDARGLGWLSHVHRDDRYATRVAWDAAMATGRPYEHEHRIRDVSGQYRWFLVRAEPLRDQDGRISRWFVAGTDIQEQRSVLEALQQSEVRFRTLIEGMPQLVWRAAAGGKWTWSSPQWCSYTGQQPDEALALGWLNAFHPEDRPDAQRAWQRAQQDGQLDIDGRIFHASEGRYRHFRTRAHAVRDDGQRIVEWLGTSTDVDDMLQLHEEQSILVGELQHRTRNLMGVVQSVTTRTVRGSSSLEEFKDSIDDRLSALARVQGLLSRRESSIRVPFDVLLDEELAVHGQAGSRDVAAKVTLDGPRGIALRSSTVQTFALAIHELMTNAVKYGALAAPAGRLHIAWSVHPAPDGERTLSVDWRETGVVMPDADAQARGGGYGRELIERALPYQLGARTTYRMEQNGVHCTIEVTVPANDGSMETFGE